MIQAFWANFLGPAPVWYKRTILAFLLLNPLLLLALGPFFTGWVLVLEFIFTLAMALRCYPLQPGGLLAFQAVLCGLTNPGTIRAEAFSNFPVILLLMFMVAGIYFMRELLLFIFTKLLLKVRGKQALSLLFLSVAAFLSAFLDALTVTAVAISVTLGFYSIYHRVASGKQPHDEYDQDSDDAVQAQYQADLDVFRAFLRSLIMHAAIGTALGGVCTVVGEPQNLLIAGKAGWNFSEFFIQMAPITMPVLVIGLIVCWLLEYLGRFGYGAPLPEQVRAILEKQDAVESAHRTQAEVMRLYVQGIAALFLIIGLLFHLAEVGLIGLTVIVLQTALNGVVKEHQLGKAFEEALPFTALLVVFFAIVAVIHDQHLFQPVIDWVFAQDQSIQPQLFFLASGLLSIVSDNVFVATVYINEIKAALDNGTISRSHFDAMAVAINTGTNIPSVATPNGQAAFLFLLTSSVAPLIRLSYLQMVIMAFPYMVAMSGVGYLAVLYYL